MAPRCLSQAPDDKAIRKNGWRGERAVGTRRGAQRRFDSLTKFQRRSVTWLIIARRSLGARQGKVSDECLADILLLPLAGLTFDLFVLSLPGASDAVASACSIVCMP
jgi:hypothetical protein